MSALTHTTATEASPFFESFEQTIARAPGPTMEHVHADHSVFLENLVSDTMRASGVTFGAARAAVELAARCHQGDPGVRAKVKSLDPSSPAAGAIGFAYSRLAPCRPRAPRAPRAPSARTGDLFGDIGNAIAHPDKAIAQVSHDVAHFVDQAVKDPIGTAANTFSSWANLPVHALGQLPIPGLKSLTDTIEHFNPATTLARVAQAGLHGDVGALVKIAKEEVAQFQAVASMIPGIGTGVSTAIGLAEALLNGGNPIEVALRAAYAAIPIPPGLREVTDTVFDAVLALLHGQSLTDVALTVARDRIPQGLPRDVFDTLVQIIVRHKPILKAAEELAVHEATKAAEGIGPALQKNLSKLAPDVLSHLGKLPDPGKVFPGVPDALKGVSGLLSRMPDAVKKRAASSLAPYVAQTASIVRQQTQAKQARVLEQRKKRIALKLPPPKPTVAPPAKLAATPADVIARLGTRAHLLYSMHKPI